MYFCCPLWRGVRVVEGARLESVYRGNSIAGSNPALSAIKNSSRKGAKTPGFKSKISHQKIS